MSLKIIDMYFADAEHALNISVNPIPYGLFNKPKVMGGADLPP